MSEALKPKLARLVAYGGSGVTEKSNGDGNLARMANEATAKLSPDKRELDVYNWILVFREFSLSLSFRKSRFETKPINQFDLAAVVRVALKFRSIRFARKLSA